MIILYLLAVAIYGITIGFNAPIYFWGLRPEDKTWSMRLAMFFPVVNTVLLVWELTRPTRTWKRSRGL